MSIPSAFDLHWASLQLHNGVHLVRFYDKSTQRMASWGATEFNSHKENEILAWVKEVNSREQPISPLSCAENCVQYAVEPLLVEGRSVGVIVIGASLVDAVLGFENIAGADIGLLVREQSSAPVATGNGM